MGMAAQKMVAYVLQKAQINRRLSLGNSVLKDIWRWAEKESFCQKKGKTVVYGISHEERMI